MNKPELLLQVEEILHYSFPHVRDIEAYYHDPKVYPDSYREVMTQELEMVRDGHGGTAFIDKDGRLLGINLYACKLDPQHLQDLLALKLPDLQALNLNETGLTAFAFTQRQPNLMHVNLSQNESLTTVRFEHPSIHLRTLDVYNSRVEALDFPAGLDEFLKLDVARNRNLKRLTFAAGCGKLRYIDASENALEGLHIPAGMNDLIYLFLRKNQLKTLTWAEKSDALETLDLRENQLTDLPDNFPDLVPALTHLFLAKNPWERIKNIVGTGGRENSRDRVISFLTSQQDPTNYLFEAKMILVGNGRRGKTSLKRKLIDEDAELPLDTPEDRTDVIEVDKYVIENFGSNITGHKVPMDFTFNIWDFGGQGKYREIQQIFCGANALYILVTAYDDDPDELKKQQDYVTFEYWLQMITAYGQNLEEEHESPILLVVNKTDVKKIFPQIGAYTKSFRQIHREPIYISCKDNLNLDLLKNKIQELLPKISDDIFTNQQSIYWLKVKQELERRTHENYLPLETYLEIASKQGLDEKDAKTLAFMLDRIGSIIYFYDHPTLSKLLVLNPEWIRKALSDVLGNVTLIENSGVLKPSMCKLIWQQYEPEEQEKFLELMLAYKLCYERTDKKGKPEYIVPACFSPEPLPLPETLTTPQYHLRLKYEPFIPAGTVNKLIVSLQHTAPTLRQEARDETKLSHGKGIGIYNELMWKNNAVFDAPGKDAYAHVWEDWEHKQVCIHLHGKGDLEYMYDVLYDTLNSLNEELIATRQLKELSIKAEVKVDDEWHAVDFFRKRGELFFANGQVSFFEKIRACIIERKIEEALRLLEIAMPEDKKDEVILLFADLKSIRNGRTSGTMNQEDIKVAETDLMKRILETSRQI
ncbi:MAG: COR domain-containing protein [Bacteroidota bacterium]